MFGGQGARARVILVLRKYIRNAPSCVALMGFGEETTLGGEPVGRAEVEVRVGNLKYEKAAGKDEITGELING